MCPSKCVGRSPLSPHLALWQGGGYLTLTIDLGVQIKGTYALPPKLSLPTSDILPTMFALIVS